jgi:hypothetical protein
MIRPSGGVGCESSRFDLGQVATNIFRKIRKKDSTALSTSRPTGKSPHGGESANARPMTGSVSSGHAAPQSAHSTTGECAGGNLECAYGPELAVRSLYLLGWRGHYGSYAGTGRLWKWRLSAPAQPCRSDHHSGPVLGERRSLASTSCALNFGIFRSFAWWNMGPLKHGLS